MEYIHVVNQKQFFLSFRFPLKIPKNLMCFLHSRIIIFMRHNTLAIYFEAKIYKRQIELIAKCSYFLTMLLCSQTNLA